MRNHTSNILLCGNILGIITPKIIDDILYNIEESVKENKCSVDADKNEIGLVNYLIYKKLNLMFAN